MSLKLRELQRTVDGISWRFKYDTVTFGFPFFLKVRPTLYHNWGQWWFRWKGQAEGEHGDIIGDNLPPSSYE